MQKIVGGSIMIIMKKQLAAALLALLTLTAVLFGAAKCESRQTLANTGLKVVLDAGHGSPDGGAVGVNGTQEKDVNLAIAQKTREVLEGRGASVVMTREGDSGLQDASAKTIREMKVSDMNKRLKIIRDSGADLFISIHMNSFSDKNVQGLHVFYDKAHPGAEELAAAIQEEIAKVTGAEVHAVKTADAKFYQRKNPPIPSILVECGFLSNPDEEAKLGDEKYRSKIAWAIASAVQNYTK